MRGIGKDGRVKWFNSRVFPGRYMVKETKRIIEVYDSYDFHVACEDMVSKVKMFIEKEDFFKKCKKLPENMQLKKWKNKKSGKVPQGQEALFI